MASPVLIVTNLDGTYPEKCLWFIGMIALWEAATLTVMTGYDYWKSGYKYMDEE